MSVPHEPRGERGLDGEAHRSAEAGFVTAMVGADVDTPGTPGGRGLRHAFRSLRHRDFALFTAGAFVSNSGSWMQNVTVPYVLYQTTHSATWVGFGTFAQFIPAVVVAPFGGVCADRFSRKWTLLLATLLGTVAALALWAVWADGHASPWTTCALVSLTGISVGFSLPAWQAFVPQLAPKDELLNAITLNSAQFNASRAVGPALGGVVLTQFGASTAFLLNAVSFGTVIIALLLIRAPEQLMTASGDRVWRQFRDSLAYARRHTGLLVAVLLAGCVAFFGAPVLQLSVVLARHSLGESGDAYAVIVAAFGTGGVVGAVFVSGYADGVRRSQLATSAVVLYGFGLIGVGLSPAYLAAAIGMFVLGVAYLMAVSAANTSIQLSVAEQYRGRVLSLYTMAITAGIPLGALLQGMLADQIGVRTTLVGAGCVLLGAAFVLIVRPALRHTLDPRATGVAAHARSSCEHSHGGRAGRAVASAAPTVEA